MATNEIRFSVGSKILFPVVCSATIAGLLVLGVLTSARITSQQAWHPAGVFFGLILVVTAAMVCRFGLRDPEGIWTTSQSRSLSVAITIAVILSAFLLAPAQQGWLMVTFVWLTLVASEVLQFWPKFRSFFSTTSAPTDISLSNGHSGPTNSTLQQLNQDEEEEFSLPSDVRQQFTRAKGEAGETIHAMMRATFAPGQRQQVLHVGFCPPLNGLDSVDCFIAEGPTARITVSQQNNFGLRIELRLPSPPPESCDVVVEVIASANAAD
jgi:hypothetical protein